MDINKSLLRAVKTEYNRSLTAAFRIAARGKTLGSFNPTRAKENAAAFVLDQVHAALKLLDSDSGTA